MDMIGTSLSVTDFFAASMLYLSALALLILQNGSRFGARSIYCVYCIKYCVFVDGWMDG